MATNYGITASTSVDALRSLVNTTYSEVYSLAVTAGSTAATTISNLLILPETVENWPLYAYMMVLKVERLLFIDLERTKGLDGTRGRILQLLGLLAQISRYAATAPADKSALFISCLVIVSSIAASRLNIPMPLASLQVTCQALASQLDYESLHRAMPFMELYVDVTRLQQTKRELNGSSAATCVPIQLASAVVLLFMRSTAG